MRRLMQAAVVAMTVVGVVGCSAPASPPASTPQAPSAQTVTLPTIHPGDGSATTPTDAGKVPRGLPDWGEVPIPSQDPALMAGVFVQVLLSPDTGIDQQPADVLARASALTVPGATGELPAMVWQKVVALHGWASVTVTPQLQTDAASDGKAGVEVAAVVDVTDGTHPEVLQVDVFVLVEQQPDHTWQVSAWKVP